MEIKVCTFATKLNKKRIAEILVKYGDLMINCDLVYYAPQKKLWIRMPEIWVDNTFKDRYCYWPCPEKSLAFQEECLKQIKEKFKIDIDKIEKLHREAAKKRGYHQNVKT